jgi:hypothetical protein
LNIVFKTRIDDNKTFSENPALFEYMIESIRREMNKDKKSILATNEYKLKT